MTSITVQAPRPVVLSLEAPPRTLRELIAAVVTQEWTEAGHSDRSTPRVSLAAAITSAEAAFTEGRYLVFLNGAPCRYLDDPAEAAREVRFVRLTALIGG